MNFNQPLSLPVTQEYGGASIVGVENIPRWAATNFSVSTGPSGQLWLSFFTPTQASVFSSIVACSGDTAAGATPTLARLGLYTSDGTTATLVARTANTTSLFAATFTEYSTALATAGGFPASYTMIPGQRYAWGLVVVSAAAMPTLYGVIPTTNATMNRTPVLVRAWAGQSDLPTTVTLASTAANNRMFYVAGV